MTNRLTERAAVGRAVCPRLLLTLPLLLLLCAATARAQSTSSTASDTTTPKALSPGAPAGSYELSGFEHVNLYNGNLDFHLPLLRVGGRGSAGYTMMLAIDAKKWSVRHSQTGTTESWVPTQNGWNDLKPGYGPGTLVGRQSGADVKFTNTCANHTATPNYYEQTITTLTFTAADGTEYELRDLKNGGQRMPVTTVCPTMSTQGASRGTVFITADGTAATFISDGVIYDKVWFMSGAAKIYPSGVLFLRDGTRYYISGGTVTAIQDRNGNRVTFGYDSSSRMISVTDPLGREITIDYDLSDPTYGLCDRIHYNGFGGADRFLYVTKTDLAGALRADFPSTVPVSTLFPELPGASNYGTAGFDPTVISGVVLPDGQQRYQFRYNTYAEMARVVLPTGGAIEYDMAAGSGVVDGNDGLGDAKEIYRRVAARRTYKDGSTTPEGRTAYNEHEDLSTPSHSYIEVDTYDGNTMLTCDRHYFSGGSARDNLIKPVDYQGYPVSDYPDALEGRETLTEQYDTNGTAPTTLLRSVSSTWQTGATMGGLAVNPRLVTTTTTVEPSGADLVTKQTAINPANGSVSFDQYNNQTDTWEYDFGAGAPSAYAVRHTHIDYLTMAVVGGTTYDYACDPASDCADGANVAHVIHLRSLPTAKKVYAVSSANGPETLVAQSTTTYDEPAYMAPNYSTAPVCWADPGQPARGNATTASGWLDVTNAWVSAHVQYDQVGNVTMTQDADGHQTQVSFSDSFSDGNNSRNTYAFPTSTASAVPDPSGQFGSATALTTASVYDFSTGLVTRATDANGVVSNFDYNDLLDRPKQGVYAVGTATQTQTTVAYDDTNRVVTVTSDQSTYGDNLLKGQTLYDGLGRTVETRQYETATAYISSTTLYDALGRANLVSRASRGQGATTDGWTRTSFDSLGRVTEVATFAGAAQPPPPGDTAICANNASCTGSVTTSYSGNAVTVTDQRGRQRRSVSDALGRLVRVDEPDKSSGVLDDTGGSPVQPTSYFYDALGNLRRVDQGGQYRFFMYDSLSRLIRAKNPEQGALSADADFPAMTDSTSGVRNGQWSIAYNYDASGNLIERKDARGVVTTYGYDALNRPTTVRYADSVLGTSNHTKDVDRHYDGATNGKGRFNYFDWDQSGNNSRFDSHLSVDQYDAMGRPLACTQHFFTSGAASSPFTVQRTYDLAGHVLTETYPSGHAVNYSYDSAGRLADSGAQPAFAGNLGDGVQRTYSSQVTYDQSGGMSQERFGTDTPLYHKLLYNSRAQLAEIRVGLYPVTDPTRGTSWERGAIINQYSSSGWGATSSGHDNNGNLREQDIFIPNFDGAGYDQGGNFGLATQSFSYDYLNRLSSASESSGPASWTQSYGYDRWGNRTINSSGTSNAPAPQFSVDTATNRLSPPAGYAMNYDAAGNLINDSYTAYGSAAGQQTRTYDAEGRMTRAQINDSQAAVYTYDADGRRVKRNTGSGGVWQVYGMGGELLAEYAANASTNSPQKEYGYRGGELLVVATPAVSAAAPSGLAATPTKSGSAIHVTLSWATTGAAYYRVERSADKGWTAPELVGTSQTNSLDDSGATPGQAYLYRVCAADAGNNCVSAYSDAAMGMAYAFADDPIVTASDHQNGLNLSLPLTPIRAVHVTDLRAAINAVRALAGLPGAQWAVRDQDLPGAMVLAAHVQELRDKLGDALTALRIPTPNYTDLGLGSAQPGTVVIQRAHFKDLRDAATSGKCGAGSGGAAATGIEWLVADQLGTPRIVIDHTGSLAGVKRHDYFPFGEEIPADGSWRTSGRGYGAVDGTRQKFTGYERDVETDLDYAQARYYSSRLGRFTSPDPLGSSARSAEPQSWNRFAYVLNNPLTLNDPTGLSEKGGSSIEHPAQTLVVDRRPFLLDIEAKPGKKEERKDYSKEEVEGQFPTVTVQFYNIYFTVYDPNGNSVPIQFQDYQKNEDAPPGMPKLEPTAGQNENPSVLTEEGSTESVTENHTVVVDVSGEKTTVNYQVNIVQNTADVPSGYPNVVNAPLPVYNVPVSGATQPQSPAAHEPNPQPKGVSEPRYLPPPVPKLKNDKD